MNSDKKLYLYSGLAIAGAVVAYMVITKKKPMAESSSEGTGTPDPETTVTTTTTGEIIDVEQANIPESLSKILNETSAKATVKLINKPIYTKLDDVRIRSSNFVNNGVVNNIMSTITNRGFLLGNVIQVVDDKGGLKNNDGRVFKWFKFKPAQITLDEMNRNKHFLTAKFLPEYAKVQSFYVREDTVKLEK